MLTQADKRSSESWSDAGERQRGFAYRPVFHISEKLTEINHPVIRYLESLRNRLLTPAEIQSLPVQDHSHAFVGTFGNWEDPQTGYIDIDGQVETQRRKLGMNFTRCGFRGMKNHNWMQQFLGSQMARQRQKACRVIRSCFFRARRGPPFQDQREYMVGQQVVSYRLTQATIIILHQSTILHNLERN